MSGDYQYDAVVIGSGPGGQKAAIQGAKAGARVLLVEREPEVGGACVHRGTIPSKAFRELAIRHRSFLQQADHYGLTVNCDPLDGHSLMRRLRDVIGGTASYMEGQIERNKIDRLAGRARFVGPHRVAVEGLDGQITEVSTRFAFVATGSRPRTPGNVPVDHEHILDSDSILSLPYLPESFVVLGAGVIGAEYASILQALGVQVTMVDSGDRPLRFLDRSLSDGFRSAFEEAGGTFIGECRAATVQWDGFDSVRTVLTDGRELRSTKLMVAAGRIANLDGLGLDSIGLEPTDRGVLGVDENYRSGVDWVYGVGDVIGPPGLASAAMEQGRNAMAHALGLKVGAVPELVPAGIYTVPEVATVGLSAEAARERHGDILVGRSDFSELARGRISRHVRGQLSLVADAKSERLLGVHVLGEGASELVHVGQMALLSGESVDCFIRNVFNFPTLAEAYRVAALDVMKQRRDSASAETATAADAKASPAQSP